MEKVKAVFERFFALVAPKMDAKSVSSMSTKLEAASTLSHEEFEEVFLNVLEEYKIAKLFDNTVSLEDLVFTLRNLVIDNYINVSMLADDIDEDVITDDMLRQVGSMFKKQGWLVCDLNEDPKLYHLAVIPQSSKGELDVMFKKLNLYIQYFT